MQNRKHEGERPCLIVVADSLTKWCDGRHRRRHLMSTRKSGGLDCASAKDEPGSFVSLCISAQTGIHVVHIDLGRMVERVRIVGIAHSLISTADKVNFREVPWPAPANAAQPSHCNCANRKMLRTKTPKTKNGSHSEEGLPLRRYWGGISLASPAAACLASGFQAKCVNGRWFSTCPLARPRFGFQPAFGPVT